MIDTVHQFTKDGDWEVQAREVLNRFATHHGIADADVHDAPGAVTVILIDDPPEEAVQALKDAGWSHRILWQRSQRG